MQTGNGVGDVDAWTAPNPSASLSFQLSAPLAVRACCKWTSALHTGIIPDVQVNWDKGSALAHLLGELDLALPGSVLAVYIGDDRTDEDAFRGGARPCVLGRCWLCSWAGLGVLLGGAGCVLGQGWVGAALGLGPCLPTPHSTMPFRPSSFQVHLALRLALAALSLPCAHCAVLSAACRAEPAVLALCSPV